MGIDQKFISDANAETFNKYIQEGHSDLGEVNGGKGNGAGKLPLGESRDKSGLRNPIDFGNSPGWVSMLEDMGRCMAVMGMGSADGSGEILAMTGVEMKGLISALTR